MLNFTVGPVQSDESVRAIGYEQLPYFRTSEFSNIMFENEQLLKKFSDAGEDARVVFLTGSGTAAMEAAVMNVFSSKDKVLVINGGSFGARFAELCKIHGIPYEEIRLKYGQELTEKELNQYQNAGCTGLLVNIHETSTGVYYDIGMISDFCKRNKIFLVVDAISSFLADSFHMKELQAEVMITSTQKTLACPPGISIIVLSGNAVKKVNENSVNSMYFDLKDALKNGERGQTPFTPAVGILLQLNKRLKNIDAMGGAEGEVKRIEGLARDFRRKIKELPFDIVSNSLSNALTPLHPLNVPAYGVFDILKNEYGIWVCPNGGELADSIFRVGHIGALTKEDNDILIRALKDMQKRGLL